MQNLPINHVIPELKEHLKQHSRLVLQAPAGAGKTTAIPLALLHEPWLQGKKIIMLEPRRLAVRSSAFRMAELLGEKVGERVGYQIKMDSIQSKKTQILIVTEGVLTRKLQHDPSLADVALIIFDEFHERSLHADLSLALALESQSILREDLKLLIMSATLNTTALSKLLGNAPIIQSEGRSFPVDRIYLDPKTPQPNKKELPFYIHKRLLKILENEVGNILVFLAGVREIKMVEKLLKESRLKNISISPLYGNLSKEEQDRAIKAPPKGIRKVVLSTNIAQTSLTIEGIKIVIDSGIQNRSIFNPLTGMDRLERHFISEDSATQRAGRAGRLSAGKAYHLWHQSKILLEHETPEILQADLTQLVLELAIWGSSDIGSFSWLDTPPPTAINHAKELLFKLGALDKKRNITLHGEAMNRFGLHPRVAHFMIKAKELKVEYEASLLAVSIVEKDIYRSGFRVSNIEEQVLILHDIAQKNSVNTTLINIQHAKYLLQLAQRIINRPLNKSQIETASLGILLAFAYPERIARQRHANRETYLLANGKGAFLRRDDSLFNSRFLVISDLDSHLTNATIYKAIALTQPQIEEYLQELIVEQEEVNWNEEEQRVEVRRTQRLGSILLKEQQIKPHQSDEVTELLLEELEELGLEALNWSKEASSLRDRLNFISYYDTHFFANIAPNIESFDHYLSSSMDTWIKPYIEGKSSIKELQRLDLKQILLGLLSYEKQQELALLAPAKIAVASGSKIAIDYSQPQQPILAVKLQEMFGTKTTPTILKGRVKLMIHLLSPASRPMQITQDLESFWTNSYNEVKKELRGKYKKHYWPDNPLEAQATSRTKKFM